MHNPLLHILISTFELQASLVIFEENFLEFFSICCTINLIFKVDLIKLKCLNGQLLRVHPHVTVSLVTEWAKEISEKKYFCIHWQFGLMWISSS